jgi:hypothetical protein
VTAPPLSALVADVYPDPQPWLTAEGFMRAAHGDIQTLDNEQLENERLLSRLRRALDPQPSEWLRERIAKLDAEAARRKRPVRRR